MNNSTDPIFEALDRLSRVADSSPVDDPMPGITRKARANRRRTAALTVGGIAAAVVAGFGVVSAVEMPELAGGPDIAGPPTTTPAPISPTPDPETSSPDPETSSPEETPTEPPEESSQAQDVPTVPGRPDLAEYERASADVDGDGAEDVVRITFPTADARFGLDSIVESEDVRLLLERAAGDTVEAELESAYVSVDGTRDLDGDGTAEVILSLTEGGDYAWIRVLTWDAGSMAEAEEADNAPINLEIIPSGSYGEGFNTALVDIGLLSWRHVGENAPPYEVQLWTWELDGTQLVATEAEQAHCMDPEQYQVPDTYPSPC